MTCASASNDQLGRMSLPRIELRYKFFYRRPKKVNSLLRCGLKESLKV